MPRTAITVQSVSAFSALDDITFTAGDAANDHEFINDGRSVVVQKNTDATAKTSTIIVPSSARVLDNSTLTIPLVSAGGGTELSISPILPQAIYNQSDGTVHIDLTDATGVSFAVVSLSVVPK